MGDKCWPEEWEIFNSYFGIKSGNGTSFPVRQETDSISRRHFSVLARLIAFKASLLVILQAGFQNLRSVAISSLVFCPNIVISLQQFSEKQQQYGLKYFPGTQ